MLGGARITGLGLKLRISGAMLLVFNLVSAGEAFGAQCCRRQGGECGCPLDRIPICCDGTKDFHCRCRSEKPTPTPDATPTPDETPQETPIPISTKCRKIKLSGGAGQIQTDPFWLCKGKKQVKYALSDSPSDNPVLILDLVEDPGGEAAQRLAEMYQVGKGHTKTKVKGRYRLEGSATGAWSAKINKPGRKKGHSKKK